MAELPELESALEAVEVQEGAEAGPASAEKRVGCAHYKRRAKFVTPCCNKLYMCRYCHDENEKHYFNRKSVTELICTECDTRQKVQAECCNCGVRFGKYTCLICNLFDDEDKKQYHCDGCGICRVGGREKFFHCERCNMCLPVQLKNAGHRCVENVSRSNCPVCLEDIHTSRIPCHIPDCGHLLHRPCFEDLLRSGHYSCPTCQTSMIDMTHLWTYLDSEVATTPMPPEYSNYKATILCKDCHKLSTVKFHVVGLKCEHCGSYNTCQTNGFHKDAGSSGMSPASMEAAAAAAVQAASNSQANNVDSTSTAALDLDHPVSPGSSSSRPSTISSNRKPESSHSNGQEDGASSSAGPSAEHADEALPQANPMDEPPQA